MAAGGSTEEPCPEREVVRQEVTHVTDPYHIEAASVRSENVVTSRLEDGSLPDLGPSLQFTEPTVLAEVADLLVEYGLIYLVRHFRQHRRFRNLKTWSQVRQVLKC